MKKYLNFILAFAIIILSPLIFVACSDGDDPDSTTYSITISHTTNGTIHANKTEAKSGETIILSVTPDVGYELQADSLKYNSQTVSNFRFIMPNENVVIDATFILKTYTISYNTNEWTTNPNPTTFNKNSETINLLPLTRKGFDFEGWYLDEEFEEEITKIEKGTTEDLILYPKFNQIFVQGNRSCDIVDVTPYGLTLEELVVPNSIDGNEITDFSIQHPCDNLITLTLEDGIKRIIANLTLWGSANLTTVNLPKSVDIFNYQVPLFKNCPKLGTINLAPENPYLYLQDGLLYKDVPNPNTQNQPQKYTYLVCYPLYGAKPSLIIPDGVTHLTDFGKAHFTSITIPASVISLNSSSSGNPFSDCSFLQFINIDEENEHFYMFNDKLLDIYQTGTSSLASAKLIHAINGGRIAYDLTENIEKGNTIYHITSIEDNAFSACRNLQYIIFSGQQLNVKIFESQPQLKAFSTSERPNPSTWSEQDMYEKVLNCQNIYWFSTTNKSNEYNCWRYVDDLPEIWQ